jgi:NAD(P)-dependent dehydrogenase (short-subunit alcohol dehydrogenase family)
VELKGKVALVTGGSRGMGEAMIHAFAAAGADVVIASRKLENCMTLAEEIRNQYGHKALPVACNVSSWEQCDDLIDSAYSEFGKVDVLVNNAGLSPVYPSLDQVSEALFDKVIGVNLKGPFRLASVIGARMAKGDGGSIINISSIEASRPDPNALPYAAAKGGLNVMTEGFAKAFGPKVRVNAIQCGPFLTDISKGWTEGIQSEFEALTPLGRCGQAEEIVGAAVYFATSASSFATGAILRLDGGMR